MLQQLAHNADNGDVLADALQPGDEALQHHGGFPGTGHTGDHGQPMLGNIHRQRLYCMNGAGFHVDSAIGKVRLSLRFASADGCAGQIRSDYRALVFRNIMYCSLGNHRTAVRSRATPHFDEPVGFFQYLRIVINQNNGIAVPDKIVHHTV